jgi:hypothetical protein
MDNDRVEASEKNDGRTTTQRVDLETLSRIKTINYHLFKSKGLRMSQSEVIQHAVRYALAHEAEFIEYVVTGREESKDSAFDVIVKATGKPWFPYGNIFKVE